jgi:uncharacterized protein
VTSAILSMMLQDPTQASYFGNSYRCSDESRRPKVEFGLSLAQFVPRQGVDLLMPSLLGLTLGMMCIFGAAVVRGYSGFGFSLLSITALSLFFEPRTIIPSIFILEVAASAHLMINCWRDVHWQSLRRLVVGCIIGTPAGVYVLARVPSAPLTVALSAVVLLLAALLARGFVLRSMPGRTATVATGVASGVLNGSIGIGGPPVVMFFFGSPAGMAIGRVFGVNYICR